MLVGPSSGSGNNIGMAVDTGQVEFFVSESDSTFHVKAFGPITALNRWYSFVHVGAGATDRAGYLIDHATNNTYIGTDVIGGPVSGTANRTWIGGFETTTGASNCLYADVAMWDEALNRQEIYAFLRGSSPGKIRPQNLQAYWPMEGAAGVIRDLSTKGNVLTVNGGSASVNSPSLVPYVPQSRMFSLPAVGGGGGGIAVSRSIPMASGIIMGGFVGQ